MEENSMATSPKTTAQYKARIEEMNIEIQRMNEQLRLSQSEIERNLAETAVLKTETRALLNRMGAAL